MNILHLLPQNTFADAFGHAQALGQWQQTQGHQVFGASGYPEASGVLSHLRLPAHHRGPLGRWQAVRALRRLILENDIQVVHAHAPVAARLAYRAVRGTYAAQVTTVYEAGSGHAGKAPDACGQKVILISPALQAPATTGSIPGQTVVIPNGLLLPQTTNEAPDFFQIGFIRPPEGPNDRHLTGLLTHVFPTLLEQFPTLRLRLWIGGEKPAAAGKDALADALQSRFGARVALEDTPIDLPAAVRTCGLVIGAGAAAILGLAFGKPVLALGRASCEGLVWEENFEMAAQADFGNLGETQQAVGPRVLSELQRFLGHPEMQALFRKQQKALRQKTEARYAMARVGSAVQEVYEEARMRRLQPNGFPVLAYETLPAARKENEPSRLQKQFEKHLKFLAFRGFSPVSFTDYEAVATGKRSAQQWPRKPVMLTFDGRRKDFLDYAVPLLQQRGWRGVVYIPPGEPVAGALTVEDLHSLRRKGWEIGSLIAAPASAEALAEAQEAAAAALGARPLSASYREESALSPEIVRAAGFQYALTSRAGSCGVEANRWAIFQVTLTWREGLFSLWQKTLKSYCRRAGRQAGKRNPGG